MVVIVHATGRPSHARQTTQTKRDTLILQAGGLGMRLTISAEKEKEEGWGGEERRPKPSQG